MTIRFMMDLVPFVLRRPFGPSRRANGNGVFGCRGDFARAKRSLRRPSRRLWEAPQDERSDLLRVGELPVVSA